MVTTQGNTFNGINQLVKLDGSGKLPAIDGSNLTGIATSKVLVDGTTILSSSGTLSVGSISASKVVGGTLSTSIIPALNYQTPLTAGTNISISSGTISNTYSYTLPSTVTTQSNTFNGASQLVQLNASTQLPAVSGVNLTNLNGSNIASGTVGVSYLPVATTSTNGIVITDNSTLLNSSGTLSVGSISASKLTGTVSNSNLPAFQTPLTAGTNISISSGTISNTYNIPMAPSVMDRIMTIIQKTSAYQRPKDWLALPTITSGFEEVAILMAIYNNDANFVAVTCAGAYQVDWGDGNIVQYASGVQANHTYSYSHWGSNSCSRGYAQTIIKITPQSGQYLTSINLSVLNNSVSNLQAYNSQFLDMALSAPNCTSFTLGTSSTIIRHPLLEQFNWIGSLSSSLTNLSYLFNGFYSFKNLVQLNTANVTSFANMFSNCYSLLSIPLLNTSSGTNFANMFSNCCSLQTVPALSFASDTSNALTSTFILCPSLSSVNITGISLNVSFIDCKLSASDMNNIFTNLPTVTGKTITIRSGNWGYNGSGYNEAIATAKGWTVA